MRAASPGEVCYDFHSSLSGRLKASFFSARCPIIPVSTAAHWFAVGD